MFQMKFYAVALLRSRGVLPARLRLIYLADGQVLDYTPDLDELLRFEKTLMAIWRAIQSAGATGDFRPSPSRLCDWCAHQPHCPVFGGTPPPYPGWPGRRSRRLARTGGAGGVIDCLLPPASRPTASFRCSSPPTAPAATGTPRSSTAHRRWR